MQRVRAVNPVQAPGVVARYLEALRAANPPEHAPYMQAVRSHGWPVANPCGAYPGLGLQLRSVVPRTGPSAPTLGRQANPTVTSYELAPGLIG